MFVIYNDKTRFSIRVWLSGADKLEEGYFQVGTLGEGNRFIELQEDEEGYLCIMIHSGSRHLGKEICDCFHNKARELNGKWYSQERCIISTVSNTYIDAGGYAHERLQQNHSSLLPPFRWGRGQGRRREQQHCESR